MKTSTEVTSHPCQEHTGKLNEMYKDSGQELEHEYSFCKFSSFPKHKTSLKYKITPSPVISDTVLLPLTWRKEEAQTLQVRLGWW